MNSLFSSSDAALMTSRTRSSSSVSFSSSGRVSFAPVRLAELLDDDYDEYGLHTPDLIDEEAVEATETLSLNSTVESMPDENVIPAGGDASDSESVSQDKSSIGSNETKETSVIGALIDKAKSKGRKLVSSKKSKSPDITEEASQCLLTQPNENLDGSSLGLSEVTSNSSSTEHADPPVLATIEVGPALGRSLARKCRTMPFFHHRMILLGVLIALAIAFPGFITGLLWGLYVSFIGFLYLFVSEPKKKEEKLGTDDATLIAEEVEIAAEANSSFEGDLLGISEGIVYRGWMNELKSRYSPAAYHVNHSQSVLIRLEGATLRISRPAKAVLKHAFHEDPTLKHSQPTMVAQTIYDLTNAQVSLRPKRLAPRRWWSRKYPIHIRFASKTSALAEVDLTRAGMTRSVSLHPVASAPDGLPIVSEIPHRTLDDTGYSAESETTDDEDASSQRVQRSNSAGDLAEFQPKSGGLSRKHKGRSIYLFARAAREKERWFHLLREACAKPRILSSGGGAAKGVKRSSSYEPAVDALKEEFGVGENNEQPKEERRPADIAMEYLYYHRNHAQFAKQMYSIMGCALPTHERGSTVSVDLGTMKWRPGIPEENSDLVESINSLATRIFFDFCRDSFWITAVKQKIQSKLATIHLPYFIETLELSELDLGTTAPSITGVYAPKMDEWGLWVDFEMKYHGGIRLVIQTSVNLIKLQSGAQTVEAEREASRFTSSVRTARYSDDDIPESPESSPDEDFGSKNEGETVKERPGKKLLSFVEKAAQSSFFQKAAKISRVAKLMEEVSSTPLILNVEVEMFEGTATCNIPPPPSDRLWYSFRRAPRISIRAVPQVGDRSVDMSTVSDWIESKLKLLIEKNLVCPNMDDVVLPAMSGNALLHMGYNR